MASNWIKLEVITPDKPEIFRLAEILNIDPDAALRKVIRFWAWADQQMIDGNAECNARGVTKSAIPVVPPVGSPDGSRNNTATAAYIAFPIITVNNVIPRCNIV